MVVTFYSVLTTPNYNWITLAANGASAQGVTLGHVPDPANVTNNDNVLGVDGDIDMSIFTANTLCTLNSVVASDFTANTVVASDFTANTLCTLNTVVASDFTANAVVTSNYWAKSLSTLNTVVASDFTANTVVASDFTTNVIVASNYWAKSLSTLNTVVASDFTANTVVAESEAEHYFAGQAAQLGTDQAAVTAVASGLREDITLLTILGGLPRSKVLVSGGGTVVLTDQAPARRGGPMEIG
jgi:hypothetical protein